MEVISSSPVQSPIGVQFNVNPYGVDPCVYSYQESVLSEMMKLRKHLVDTYYIPMKGKNWYDQTIEDEDRSADQDTASEEEMLQVVAPKKKKKKIFKFKTNLEISYITCTSCNKNFPFTAHQANEYKKKGWAPRKKCRNCKST